MANLRTLSVFVENQPGVLARIAGLIARRDWNIESLAVGPTDDPSFSRMTLVVDQDQTHVEQIVKQLYKLINVIKISELPEHDSVERELLLVKVGVVPERRFQVVELAEIFGATICDVGSAELVLQLAGEPQQINDLLRLLEPFNVLEAVRTGRIGLQRAPKGAVLCRMCQKWTKMIMLRYAAAAHQIDVNPAVSTIATTDMATMLAAPNMTTVRKDDNRGATHVAAM